MQKMFLQIPCLSESRVYSGAKTIRDELFNKKVDSRYIEVSIQHFIKLNKHLLDFIGISVDVNGSGHDLEMKFVSSNYAGAIPVKQPYDGIVHGDLQVLPRFDSSNKSIAELTKIISILKHSIVPEFYESAVLTQPYQLRPPIYADAIKYIELFEAAYHYRWQKFNAISRTHSYPKSGTRWDKYALKVSDPNKALLFPAVDNVLSIDHREWQQLRYVFDIAKASLNEPSVPTSIKYTYQTRLAQLEKKVESIVPVSVDYFNKNTHDPMCITRLKDQANLLLKQNTSICSAWRIDIAELFERYVQHVVSKAASEISGKAIPNHKIWANGNVPFWGLRYLEPDIYVRLSDMVIMADAKYKSNMYASAVSSDTLKETHRSDLHQLLAYCSFEPQKKKAGILFYPNSQVSYKKMYYTGISSGSDCAVVLFGIPFAANSISDNVKAIKELLINQMKELEYN